MSDTHEVVPGVSIVEPGTVCCDGCGRDVEHVAVTITVNAEDAEAFAPFEPRDYHVCWPCWLQAQGVRMSIEQELLGSLVVMEDPGTVGDRLAAIPKVHTVTVDGHPCKGARVTYYSDPKYSVAVRSGRTNSLGQVTFDLPPDVYYVTVDAPGQERVYDTVDLFDLAVDVTEVTIADSATMS